MMLRARCAPLGAAALALLLTATAAPIAATGTSAAWSYEGDTGPEHWAELDAAYALCGSGRAQSPIDLPAMPLDEPDGVPSAGSVAPADDYAPSPLVVTNNGHAIEVEVEPGSWLPIEGIDHELRQFHFHSPSEHTVAGVPAAMEMHLVHASAEGSLAVIGVLLVEGEESAALAPIWEALPDEAGETVAVPDASIDPDELLPEDRRFVAYAGSLTTPPCSEGVRWHVLVEPIELSTDQLDAFRAIHHGTNRPVQPLGERVVE